MKFQKLSKEGLGKDMENYYFSCTIRYTDIQSCVLFIYAELYLKNKSILFL